MSVVVVSLALVLVLGLGGLVLGLAGLVLRLGRLRLEERILLDLSLAGDQLLQAVVFRDL